MITTRCILSLEKAVEWHMVLIRIKEAVAGEQGKTTQECALHMNQAVAAASSDFRLQAETLGLSFCFNLRARALIGNKMLRGVWSTDFLKAVRDRDYLIGAKCNGWESFRSAWIMLMLEMSNRPKTADEARAIADAAYRDCQTQRVARAVSALERALISQDRAVELRLAKAFKARTKEKAVAVEKRLKARHGGVGCVTHSELWERSCRGHQCENLAP